nr:probable histone acetyltransferase HAC-like 1 [Lolium perenne]
MSLIIVSIIWLYSICAICVWHHLAAQMNQVSSSAIGGSDVPPPPEQQQMLDAVGLTMGVDTVLAMRRSINRDRISEHIESKKYLANLQGMLPDLATQLEEILFKVHGCKREYYNMVERLFEPELQLAIQLLSVQNPQNQELSRNIQTFPAKGTDFWAPGSIKGESGNPMMYSDVTYKMGLASSSLTGMVLPQRKHPKVMEAKEVPTELKFSCPVCMNELVDASSTICGHIFCENCIKASIQAQRKCPTCRKKLTLRGFHRLYLPATN